MAPALDVERIVSELEPGGVLSRRLPGYEARPEQATMARAVAAIFAHGGVVVVEAGTGTGKSLAYLVPAIHWSRESGERVIVSTRTINLQEQLVHTDLPFLAKNLGVEFSAALVKGRGNYLCLRKATEIREQPALLVDDAARVELTAILEWAQETEDGSLSDLGFVPRSDTWESVMVEHDDCLRTRCPEYEPCFFYRARRAAAKANVLVVNHHLLMADLALRAELPDDDAAGVLPPATRVVVDEAHHLEDVATDYFGGAVTARRIERVLARLQHPRAAGRGVLPALLERLVAISAPDDRPAVDGAKRWIEERLRPRARELAGETARAFDVLLARVEPEIARAATAGAAQDEQQLRVVPPVRDTEFWTDVAARIADLARSLAAFAEDARGVLDRLGGLSEPSSAKVLFLSAQLQALAGRLGATALDLGSFVDDDPDLCRWFAIRRSRERAPLLSLSFAPVEAGPHLRHTLFESFEGIVLTSATLTVEKRFDYFLERSGLALVPPDRVERLRLPSPFRFADQALVAVPEDVPEPEQPGYEAALHEAIARTVEASRGGAFVLFTSYAALSRAHTALAERLDSRGMLPLRQGEASRHALLETFRADRSSVLFATDSFWEGVDVRGEGLRAVVIARLPFRVPTEPVQQARMEAISVRGGNPFAEYGLPQAVIRLRQGFGRLIRSRDDMGVVVILDSRIVRRRYGEVFLESLPPARLISGPSEVIFAEVEKFYGG